ncbi:hypothetical protein EAF04_003387 [Stromatinia cepivora]|nr:hypothetical protein EAF04_003387 [Stromatinia cepivora]
MFERGESGGQAPRRKAPAQPSHRRNSGAGAARKRKAEEQGESSAQGFRRGQAKRATEAGATGVNTTPKPVLSPEEKKRAQEERMKVLRADNERAKEEMFPQFKKKDRGQPAVALDRMGCPTRDSGCPRELIGRYS